MGLVGPALEIWAVLSEMQGMKEKASSVWSLHVHTNNPQGGPPSDHGTRWNLLDPRIAEKTRPCRWMPNETVQLVFVSPQQDAGNPRANETNANCWRRRTVNRRHPGPRIMLKDSKPQLARQA